MTDDQRTCARIVFACRPGQNSKGSNPNPFIYGQPWAVGNCFTAQEKAEFLEAWRIFEEQLEK